MINLKEISIFGNGLYRMSVKNQSHIETLLYSINKGYNLIDTSTNYMLGNSELLVGKLLKENKYLSDKVFIISKGGYIT